MFFCITQDMAVPAHLAMLLQSASASCNITPGSAKPWGSAVRFYLISLLYRWPQSWPEKEIWLGDLMSSLPRGLTVFLVFLLSLMCLIYALIYLTSQGKTWPCSAINTARPCCPSHQWDQYWQYWTISLSPVKNNGEWARSIHWEMHHKVLRENWENNSLFCLLNSHSKSKSFQNLGSTRSVVFHPQPHINSSAAHQGAMEKHVRHSSCFLIASCQAAISPGSGLQQQLPHRNEVCREKFRGLPPWIGRAQSSDRGKKWPLLTLYSEATWKEGVRKIECFPLFLPFLNGCFH